MNIDLPAILGWQLTTLLALVAADVLAGVFAALRTGEFDWAAIAQFYKTMVIPYLGGYFVLTILVNFTAVEFLSEELQEPFSDVALTAAWLAVVTAIGNSVLSNLQRIWSGASG